MIAPAIAVGERARRSIPALVQRARADSLTRNSVYIMATTASTALLGYLYWIVAARSYPPGAVGLAATLISALTLTSIVANLGLGSTLVQTLPKRAPGEAWSRTLNAALVAGTVAGTLGGVAVVLALPLFSPELADLRGLPYALAFVAGVPLWTVATLLDYAFMASRAAGNMLVRNVIFAELKIPLLALPLLLTNLGWHTRMTGAGILASWVLASVAGVLCGFMLVAGLRSGYRPTLGGMAQEVRSQVGSLAGHHFINLGGAAPMYLLPTLVAVRLSTVETAYFYTTWMIGSLFFMVSPAVASALFAEGIHGGGALRAQITRSALLIGGLLAPVMVLFLLGGRTILAVFGPQYPRHGVMLLLLLILSAVPDALTNVSVSVLRVRRRLRVAGLLNLGMAALTLGLTWVLLPRLGIEGAGWAWLGAQIAGSLAVGVGLLMARYRKREADYPRPDGSDRGLPDLA